MTKLIGFEPLPELPKNDQRTPARRDPERGELVRTILNQLDGTQAAVLECPDAAELQTLRCTALVYGKKQIATRAQGLTLRIYRKPAQARLF